uniref:Uncharacterized protein n=1 Tax=Cacopsylla melanoneura TaxID=428564 RepID=A0A8D8SQE4_9HEMI
MKWWRQWLSYWMMYGSFYHDDLWMGDWAVPSEYSLGFGRTAFPAPYGSCVNSYRSHSCYSFPSWALSSSSVPCYSHAAFASYVSYENDAHAHYVGRALNCSADFVNLLRDFSCSDKYNRVCSLPCTNQKGCVHIWLRYQTVSVHICLNYFRT